MKASNNRFQGTLHKVSGPLNRDVGDIRRDNMKMKPDPLSWEWVRWDMAVLVIICVFLIFVSHDKLKSALLIPVIPIAFKLTVIWRGLKKKE